ncbi:hypothetical protein Tco_0760496 [Tanacetum coccineum]
MALAAIGRASSLSSQGDKDDARPIAARAMHLLRSETSRVEHAEAAKGTERFGKTKDGEICDLYALGDMIPFVSTPMETKQCLTFILEGGPCTNRADTDCYKFLKDTTDWGPHVETTIIKPASFKSTLSCFNLFLVLLVILFRTFDPKVDGPSTNKVVGNDQNLDVEGVNDKIHFYDSVDWLVRDEEIDASGQRTPIPPMPWIHVNSCKLDPQVSDATAKITSSDDHRIKRKRRQYRPKVKNIRHATPIPPAPPLPRAPSLAQAPAPVQGKKSIFQIMFKNPRKATHIPFVTTTVPPPPPPPPSWSLFSNCFTSRNKIKNIPSSKNSKLPPLPPTGPPPQPELQRQRYDQQSSICSSSESSCLPPPLPPLNMPEMKDKYYGNFVRLGSYNSNTSSSPDLQPMGQPPTFIKGEIINCIEQGKGKVTAKELTNKKKALE